jgi:hypothetical protein
MAMQAVVAANKANRDRRSIAALVFLLGGDLSCTEALVTPR